MIRRFITVARGVSPFIPPPVLAFALAAGYLLTALPLSAQTIQWARQFGTERVDEAYATAAGPDGVYVAGDTFGSFPDAINAGNRDAFIRKLDTAGNTLWTRQFGTLGSDTITAVAADATGVYVVGRTSGALPNQTNAGSTDAFVRKYDPSGNELWTRQFGTDVPDEGMGAALDTTGFYVAGFTAGALPGQVSGSLGQNDAFLRKYTASGEIVWTRQFGTSSGDVANAAAANSSGVYIAGTTGGPLVSESAGGDSYVRKYDSDGNVVWTRQITSQNNQADIAYSVAVQGSGVYVSGDTVSTFAGQTKVGGLYDAWVRKFDLAGNEQWTRQLGTTEDDTSYGVVAAFDWVYVTVYTGNRNPFVRRYDLNGTDTGTLTITSNDREFFYGMAADATSVYVAGSKDGSTLGQTPMGDLDALLLKIPHPPFITSVGNAFGDRPLLAPNTWVAIKGTGFSVPTRIWEGPDFVNNLLPVVLDGVTVSVNGKPAFLYFISPNQINILLPPDTLPQSVNVQVTNNGVGSNVFAVAGAAQSLSFFEFISADLKAYVYGRHAGDNTIIGPTTLYPGLTTPVKPGESIYIAATGFGTTDVAIVSGALTQSGNLPMPFPVIRIGGIQATVSFAGLVSVGTYQINFDVPQGVPDGELPITVTYNGLNIQPNLLLAVKQ